MKKRREITIEIEREIVVGAATDRHVWCRRCHRLVERLAAEYAAQTLRLEESEIKHLREIGKLHDAEPASPPASICSNSLAELIRRIESQAGMPRLPDPGCCPA